MQGCVDLVGLGTYRGGMPANPILTGLNIEQLRSCDKQPYCYGHPVFRSWPLFPISQGTLPWQPILCNNGKLHIRCSGIHHPKHSDCTLVHQHLKIFSTKTRHRNLGELYLHPVESSVQFYLSTQLAHSQSNMSDTGNASVCCYHRGSSDNSNLDAGEVHLVDVRQHLSDLIAVLKHCTCRLRQVIQRRVTTQYLRQRSHRIHLLYIDNANDHLLIWIEADWPLTHDTLNAPWLLTDNSNGLVIVIRNYHWLNSASCRVLISTWSASLVNRRAIFHCLTLTFNLRPWPTIPG